MERKNLALLCAGVVCFWLFALAFGTAQGNGLRQQNPAVQAAADQTQPVQPAAAQPALELPCRAACLIDQQTGTILCEKNADQQMPIASITKVMTLLLTFEAVHDGRIAMDTLVPVSEHAYHMGGSQIWLEPGEQFTLDEMIKAICVSSANDAAVAVAELVGGSEPGFVQMMNARAAELGMVNTTFHNACGLDTEGHLSTAHDVAIMSREILNTCPEVLHYTGIWTDTLRGGATQLVNTNKLLKRYNGITGLKTGTTSGAGVCISASATRDGLDLIVTNSQREKTAWDKIEEVRYLREVLEKAKTKPRFVELLRRIVEKTFEDGELQTDGTRDFIAKVLHTSTTQIGRYDTIIRHLSPEFTEELKADRINLSTAYELAGLPVENQNAAFKEYHLTGAISIKAAREWKRPAPPAPPAENTATPTQAERPQKEREPVVERDKVPDTQATPPYSAAVERDTADGTQDTKPTESTQQSAPRRPQATRSSECGICPYCGAKFDAAKVIEYSIRGAAEGKPHTCQHCGQRVKIFCSVSYFCSPAEE